MTDTPRNILSVSNVELYDRWAKVYDTDGNVLQAIDEQEVPDLLLQLLTLLPKHGPYKAIDLGCGTGRNTVKLFQPPFGSLLETVIGLDASPGMLETARQRCESASGPNSPKLELGVFDVLNPTRLPPAAHGADMVLATLVVEHVPLAPFFRLAGEILRPGGILLLTNMHDEMGRRGQAGFVDTETGDKVRGTSFAHGVEEVVHAAEEHGFEVLGKLKERGVLEEDLVDIGPRGRKWVGCQIWYGGLMRLR